MKFRVKNKRVGQTLDIGELIPQLINQLDLKKEFTIETLHAEWSDMVGDIMSTHTAPTAIFGKVLIVKADHPVFANEFSMMKDSVLVKIQERLGPGSIKEIRMDGAYPRSRKKG